MDDVKIESDNKEIKSSQMNQYVRQSPNAKWFSLFRFPLYIYSASGMDSTKWINRFWRKLGDAPVIYSKDAAQETQQEIEKAVRNMGYMGAVVDLKEEAKGKRMKVSYDIHSGSPYIINNIAYDIADSKIRSYLEADSAQTLLHEGMRFDVNVLDEERQRITQYLQNRGYYRFNKDFITFQADTMLNTHKVAETFIIGLCSGVMGVVLCLLLLIPGNMLIHHIAGDVNVVASLPPQAALILIVLATLLTMLGGLIPARSAAKSNPVKALRSE